MNEEIIKFKGDKQFLKLQNYLIKLGKSFPSGTVYKSLNEFNMKNGLTSRNNEGFFTIKCDSFTCETVNELDFTYDHYITYKDIFCMALDIE